MDDLISRQAVLNILKRESHKWGNDCRDWEEAINEITQMPSAEKTETVTEFADRCRECGTRYIPKSVIDDIRAEIEEFTSRYTVAYERGGMGQIVWSDRLIKECDVLQIIDKHIKAVEE